MMLGSALAGGAGSSAVMSYRLGEVEKRIESAVTEISRHTTELAESSSKVRLIEAGNITRDSNLAQLRRDRDDDRRLLTDIDRKLSVLLDRSGKPMP